MRCSEGLLVAVWCSQAFIRDISKSMHVIRIDYSEFRSAEAMADEIARQRSDWPTSPAAAIEWAKRERA